MEEFPVLCFHVQEPSAFPIKTLFLHTLSVS